MEERVYAKLFSLLLLLCTVLTTFLKKSSHQLEHSLAQEDGKNNTKNTYVEKMWRKKENAGHQLFHHFPESFKITFMARFI